MKFFILFSLLSFSNVFALETTCTGEKVILEVMELLRAGSHYEEDGTKVTMEDVKIGGVMPFPNYENRTHFYVPVSMKMTITSPEGTIKTDNGLDIYWFDAKTCENTSVDFMELKPVAL